jgi:cell division protein FtsZ
METDGWKGVSIKVAGIGGAGSNAVDRMIQMGIPGVSFIAANCDAQALARSEAPHKIQLGAALTHSLGAGGNPAIGARAAIESREALGEALCGADMVFVAAGMGGGTGTGAAPVVAQIAQAEDALTIAVVSRPFSFEGNKRAAVAEEGIARLREQVDALLVVSNDHLLDLVGARTSLDVAFRVADDVLRQAVQGIAELVTRPGLINLGFAGIRSIMEGAGGALITVGYGEGEEKAIDAVKMALESPLLNIGSISEIKDVLVNVTGGPDLTLAEVSQAMDILSHVALPQARILFGAVIDPHMRERVEITLIATGVEIGSRTATQPQAERIPLTEIFGEAVAVPAFVQPLHGEELAVPAFMRSHKRARVEELMTCLS